MKTENDVWICKKCGTENHGKFCSNCGVPKLDSVSLEEEKETSSDMKAMNELESSESKDVSTSADEHKITISTEAGIGEIKEPQPSLNAHEKPSTRIQEKEVLSTDCKQKKPKKKTNYWLIGCIVVAVIIALFILSKLNSNSKIVNPTKIEYTEQHFQDTGISFEVPKEWKQSEIDGSIKYVDNQGYGITVYTKKINHLNPTTYAIETNKQKIIEENSSCKSLDEVQQIKIDDQEALVCPGKDYTKIIVPLYNQIFCIDTSWNADESNYSEVADYIHSTIKIPNELTLEEGYKLGQKVVSIEATYSGETTIGTVLDKNNEGIHVKANLAGGDIVNVAADYFTVVEPKTLEGSSSSTITIKVTTQDKQEFTCDLTVECSEDSPEVIAQKVADYKNSCNDFSYDELARNPDAYKGQQMRFRGKIIQIIDSSKNNIQMRIEVTEGRYTWDDVVLVDYTYKDGQSKFLEDDIVTFYGIYGGTFSYESVLGATITVPLCFAEYID